VRYLASGFRYESLQLEGTSRYSSTMSGAQHQSETLAVSGGDIRTAPLQPHERVNGKGNENRIRDAPVR
jgi:hypothetical protein